MPTAGQYITVASAEDNLGASLIRQLLNLTSDTADITTNARLLSGIAVANAMIDDHLRMVYSLPLPDSPTGYPTLISAGIAILRYELLKGRQGALTAEDQAYYDAAIKYLRDIGRGVARLDVDTTANQPSPPYGAVVTATASAGQSPNRTRFDAILARF